MLGGWIEFDRKKFLKRQKRVANKALNLIGLDLRQDMKDALKVRKRPSDHAKSGEPPFIKSKKSPLRNLILYYIDRAEEKIIVAPKLWPLSKSPVPVPGLLERGGRGWYDEVEYPERVREPVNREHYFLDKGRWKRAVNSAGFQAWVRDRRAKARRVKKVINIHPHPFIEPTLQKYNAEDRPQKALRRAVEWGQSLK